MVAEAYKQFNESHFSPEKYAQVIADIRREAGDPCLRMCELPLLITRAVSDQIVEASRAIIEQTMALNMPIAPLFDFPRKVKKPSFFIVDFAMTREGPRLIELQGFASNLLFMPVSGEIYKGHYGLGDDYQHLFCDIDDIRRTIMGNHESENVILMEINPWQQPSRRDFILTQRLFGVPVVNITDVIRKDRSLFYRAEDGREVPIRRIYNRVVPGEYQSLAMDEKTAFRYNEDLDVEWAGHPAWFLRASKYVLPHLKHPTVPRTWFLDQMSAVPMDLENYVLKPAFLNAGIGVKINLTEADINAVDITRRGQYLLMEKVAYEPVVPTPEGGAMCAEVRAMFVWPDDGNLTHTGFSARVMKGNDVNAGVWGGESWCGLAPVFAV